MKKIVLALISLTVFQFCNAQQTWSKWKWMLGDWVNEPALGVKEKSNFSLKLDLGGNILIRKNHTILKDQSGFGDISHDDMMVIYGSLGVDPFKAIYFDNEGNVLNYLITYENDKSISILSTFVPGSPVYKITYTYIDEQTIDFRFESSQDNSHYALITEIKYKRKQG